MYLTRLMIVALFLTLAGCATSVGTTTTETQSLAVTTAPTPTTQQPTTIPEASTSTTLSEAEALSIVEGFFDAYNSGDVETFYLWREGGLVDEEAGSYDLAVESRFTVQGCTYRGYGTWAMDSDMEGHGFDCEVVGTDLLLTAAGIELQMTYNWVVGPTPEESLGGSNEEFDVAAEFMAAFRRWLYDTHPDVYSSIRYGLGGFVVAEDVPVALTYVDEFVAQSSDYPLSEPVPAGDYGGPLERAD